MTIFTEFLTGDATGYEVYAGLAFVQHYLGGSSSAAAQAFRALGVGSDAQKQRVIEATRYVDQNYWQGTATGLAGGTPTTLAFPRSGLTDVNGAALDPTNVPKEVNEAVAELAALIALDPDTANNVDTGSNVSSLGAGPAQISFFRPQSVHDGNATVLPTLVDRLIGRWLAGAGAKISVGGFASGVCSFKSTPRTVRFPV